MSHINIPGATRVRERATGFLAYAGQAKNPTSIVQLFYMRKILGFYVDADFDASLIVYDNGTPRDAGLEEIVSPADFAARFEAVP